MTEQPRDLFADALFAPPAQTIGADDLFILDEPMRAFIAERVKPQVEQWGPQRGLFEAVRHELRIDYDASRTRTARETFAMRSGNCLSLVIMTAALARELKVPAFFRSVYGHDTWSRTGGMTFQSGHVNLQLGNGHFTDTLRSRGEIPLLVDFLSPDSAAMMFSREQAERTIVAMYLNNRAVETMIAGDIDTAYWWARAAIVADPAFQSSYNTLGVLYQRHGNLAESERALRHILVREPDNANALGNLVRGLARQGRTAEAEAMRARLAAIEPYPPFYYLDHGLAALKGGNARAALALLNKELDRMPYDDEVHFAIAVADLQLGDLDHARQHLHLAIENSTARGRRDLYAAKLDHLRLMAIGR